MEEYELEIGETLLIGECLLTVVDVEGDEVTFRIENISERCESGQDESRSSEASPPRPR